MSNVHAALEYVRAGVPVFPCKPNKAPLTANGFQDATVDEAQVKAWWNAAPAALIGVPCGPASGFDVLDIDMHGDDDGKASLAAIEAEYGELPETVMQTTANDGLHYLFVHAPELNLVSGYLDRDTYPGVEVRTDGAYIIVAPSVGRRADGTSGAYVWEADQELIGGQMAAWPDSLRPLLETVERKSIDWSVGKKLEEGEITDAVRAYVASAVEAECQAVAEAPNGSQEATLNKAALKLGSLVGAGVLAAHEAQMRLETAALQMTNYNGEDPWKVPDIKHKIERGMGDGIKAPRDLSGVGKGDDIWGFGAAGGEEEAPAVNYKRKPNGRPPHLPYTDTGNRDRLVHRWGHDLRYIREDKTWVVWNGAAWVKSDHAAQEMAIETMRSIRTVEKMPDDADKELQDALEGWCKASQARGKVEAALAMAASHRKVSRSVEDFDMQPHLFGVRNGTIDLSTGLFRPAEREDMQTLTAPVEYDPAAACPTWELFISQLFPSDPMLAGYIQRFLGHCLTGNVDEQKFPIWYGGGGNGKSTLFNVIAKLMGPYALTCDPKLFSESALANNNQLYMLAKLKGKRFVVASETTSRNKLDEALVKQTTGGDRISARHPHGDYFEFDPTHKIVFSTNHEPEVRAQDDGTWRRLVMIPFDVKFGEPGMPPKIKDMKEKLWEERAGILNWLVAGCRHWYNHGLQTPPSVTARTAQFKNDEDLLKDFFDECCVFDAEDEVSKKDLHGAYCGWSERQPLSLIRFGKEVKQRANTLKVQDVRRGDGWFWRGASLNAEGRQKLLQHNNFGRSSNFGG